MLDASRVNAATSQEARHPPQFGSAKPPTPRTPAADELIGGVIITLGRVFQSGFDDLKVPLHTREGKPAGELQLILKWQPEGGVLPAQQAQQAHHQQPSQQQQQQYPPPAVAAAPAAAAAAAASAYPPPAVASAPPAAAGYPPSGGYPPPAVSAPAYPDSHSASVPPATAAPAGQYPPPAGETAGCVCFPNGWAAGDGHKPCSLRSCLG